MSTNSLEKSVRIGSPVVNGTSGSVLFIDANGALAQDNAQLFWDDTTNRLGLGTSAPGVKFSFGTSVANVARFLATYESGNTWSGIGMDSVSEGIRIAGDRTAGNPLVVFGSYSNDGAFTWTERVRINGNGRIGIGNTAAPGTAISFGTSVVNVARIIGIYESGNNWSGFGMDPTTEGIRMAGDRTGSNPIMDIGYYSTDGLFTWTSRHQFLANGDYNVTNNLGIGTTSPGTRLSFGTAVANVARIISTYHSGNTWSGFGMDSTSEGIRIAGGRDSTAPITDFGFYSTDGLFTFTNRMRVRGDGNVGIGSTTPGFLLTFADAVGDKISLYGQSGTHYGFGIQSGQLQIHTSDSGAAVVFGYGESGTFTETARITGSANLLIGTTAAGTSATQTIAIDNGTEPTSSPADLVQLYSVDLSIGNAT